LYLPKDVKEAKREKKEIELAKLDKETGSN